MAQTLQLSQQILANNSFSDQARRGMRINLEILLQAWHFNHHFSQSAEVDSIPLGLERIL